MARNYPFEVPYHLNGMFAGIAVSRLKDAGVWEELSADARDRLENCGWGGVEVTKADLDGLSDDAYKKLLALLP